MKKQLIFNYDTDDEFDTKSIERIVNVDKAYRVLYDMSEEVFRNAIKYNNYGDNGLKELISKCPVDSEGHNIGDQIIEKLSEVFNDLLIEKNIDIF